MGRLTPEKIQEIRERYAILKSYRKVADELGLDPKTVRRHIRDIPSDGNNSSPSVQDGGGVGSASSRSAPPTPTNKFSEFVRMRESGASVKQVVLALELQYELVEKFEIEFSKLNDLGDFGNFYSANKDHIPEIIQLLDLMRKASLDPTAYVELMKDVKSVEDVNAKKAKASIMVQKEEEILEEMKTQRAKEQEKVHFATIELQNLSTKISKAKEDFQISFRNLDILSRKADGLKQTISNLEAIAEDRVARL